MNTQALSALILFSSVVSSYSASTANAGTETRLAERILDYSGVEGGLVVHVGCGNGKLTAALRAGDAYLVRGVDTDQEKVDEAREYIKSLELYGDVSIARLEGKSLPFADDLVNLVVSRDLGEIPMDEVMRVLCPNGVALIRQNGRVVKKVKAWPDEIGDWTHFLQDASNNAVAADTKVGPPRRMKWVCGPLWSRDHEFNSSLSAMVSGGGRLFYVFDEGLPGVTFEPLPERWTLIARDAFNGTLLWKRPLTEWGSTFWKKRALRSVPMTIPRRMVAQGNRLFITLSYDSPVSALDAATGEIVTTYPETDGAEEIRCIDGILMYRKGKNILAAIDTGTGKQLWEVRGKIQQFSWAAQDGRVFYQDGAKVLCLRAGDGEELWQSQGRSPASLLVVNGGKVLVSRKQGLEALSAENGESIWSAKGRAGKNELFVANDMLWHWQGGGIVGRDLERGKLVESLDTSDVFTPGHHPRCYQSKATEKFIITPNRGAEFVSVAGESNTQNDWLRGPCRYGIMPGNGLLYVGPNPCFCYPGVKLLGFNALAPAGPPPGLRTARLLKGDAYEQGMKLAKKTLSDNEWPTFRHDARRTGSIECEVPEQVETQWRVNLKGKLTQPVLSDNRLYVAAGNEHTLYAFGANDGRRLWDYTAGGRIDSPPTIYGRLVLFGSADGCVYCLRASDGKLIWRFRAAPSDRKIVAFGQLESPWRVHGSILMKDGVAYCTAGRSTYLDGGIRVFGLDPATGRVLYKTCLDTWSRTRKDALDKPFIPAYHMEGALSDVLVSEGDYIYLGQYKLDRKLNRQKVPYIMPDSDKKANVMDLADRPFTKNMESQPEYEKVQHDWQWRVHKEMMTEYNAKYGGTSMGDRKMGLHISSTSGFLDDSWFNRTYWMYSKSWPGYYIGHRGAKTGQLLVVGPHRTYALQAYPSRNLQSPQFKPGNKGYLLLADDNDNEPVLASYTRGIPKGIGYTRKEPPAWFKWVPVRIRAMVLAGDSLFVAGPPDVVNPADPMAAFEGRSGAVLRAISAKDGGTVTEQKLDSPPVFDGMIAAKGWLYLSLKNGTVLCLGRKR